MQKWSWIRQGYKGKLKVSWLWCLFLLFAIYTNTTKTLCYIFLMLSVHEGMHVLAGYIFHYPVEKIIIYPFGVCAQMEYIGYGNIAKELLIVVAGPSVHLLFPYFFRWLAAASVISYPYMEYLQMLNMSIFIFNILPIYPLDGGRIIQCLAHSVLPFRKAQISTLLISVINLYLLFYYRFLSGLNGWIILVFLGFQIIVGFRQLTLAQISFYHYRYLHPVKGRDKLNKGDDLYRARHNIMWRKNGWMDEHQWLALHFHRKRKDMKNTDPMI